MKPSGLDRREFGRAAALAALAGVTVFIEEGCGGGSSPSGSSGATGPPAPVAGQISGNHGHQAVISTAALQAGGDLSLDIQGGADHPHSLVLAAAEVISIRQGGQVSKDATTTAGHMHVVTFRGTAPGPGGIY